MDLLCPHCQKRLNFPDGIAGQVVRCPLCMANFPAPAPASILPPEDHPVDLAPLLPHDLAVEEEPPVLHITPEPEPIKAAPWTVTRTEPSEGYAFAPDAAPAMAAEAMALPPATGDGAARPSPGDVPLATPLPAEAGVPVKVAPTPGAAVPEIPQTPPKPKSEYRHTFTLYFRRDVLNWFAPAGLALLFLLSFFPWETDAWRSDATRSGSLWQLAFREVLPPYMIYLAFLLLLWPLSIGILVLQKKWIGVPPAVKPIMPWSSLILAGIGLIAFLILFGRYAYDNLSGSVNPSTIWLKIAIRIHFLVILGALLHFWLVRRAARKLQEPRITLRW